MAKGKHYRDENAIRAFGSRVRELREKEGVTIEEFANSVGIHVTQLSRIERGETNVSISYIYLLAKSFKVATSELLKD